jgi:hypothetical protein
MKPNVWMEGAYRFATVRALREGLATAREAHRHNYWLEVVSRCAYSGDLSSRHC